MAVDGGGTKELAFNGVGPTQKVIHYQSAHYSARQNMDFRHYLRCSIVSSFQF